MKVMLRSLLALSLLFAGCGAAFAAAGTLYIDTGGSANNSGSTNYSNNIYSGTAGSITIGTTTTAGTFSGASVTLTTNGCANAGNPAAGAAVYDTTNSSYIGLVATCSGVTLTVGNTNVLNGPSHAVGNGDALYFAGPTITLDTATNFGISKTASGSFTTASATITITGASCTGINNGMGIYDSTASAVVGVVNSCSLGVITLGTAAGATANSKTNSSGSSDTILFGLPGCVGTGGTCDGTQSISLTNNSTNILNPYQKIFWIVSYTGCTGSGSCVVTVNSTYPQGSPSCQTATLSCSSLNWSIGGQWVLGASKVIEGALKPLDTAQVNNNQASVSATNTFNWVYQYNNQTGGYAFLVGNPASSYPALINGSANSVIGSGTGSAVLGLWVQHLELRQTSTGSAYNIDGSIYDTKVTHPSGGGASVLVNFGGGNDYIGFSEVLDSSGTGDCIANNASVLVVEYTYISGCGAAGIHLPNTNPNGTSIIGNLITGSTGRGIYISGTVASNANGQVVITGNTIYNNTLSGIEAQTNYGTRISNNIIFNNGGATAYNVYWDVGPQEGFGMHAYNQIYSTSCLGGAAGSCVSGFTLNSTDLASNPNFVNAGSGNYAIPTSSAATNAGFPGQFLGLSTTTGYRAIGAVQPQVTAGNSNVIGE